MKQNHYFLVAYIAALGLLATTFVVIGANTDFSRYLNDASSTAITPNVSQKVNYTQTINALSANIGFNILLLFVGSAYIFLLIDLKNKTTFNVISLVFFLFWLGSFDNFIKIHLRNRISC